MGDSVLGGWMPTPSPLYCVRCVLLMFGSSGLQVQIRSLFFFRKVA